METIKIKVLNENGKLLTRANPYDAGLDLYASEEVLLGPGEIKLIPTSISLSIDPGYVGLIRDRSSVGSSGLKVTCGVIDSGYRGEVKVVLINLSSTRRVITKGMKFAQILIVKIAIPAIIQVDSLEETVRGDRGFGSSGSGAI